MKNPAFNKKVLVELAISDFYILLKSYGSTNLPLAVNFTVSGPSQGLNIRGEGGARSTVVGKICTSG